MTGAFLESEVERLAKARSEEAAIKVSRLIEDSSAVNRLLNKACRNGCAKLAKELLGRGADPLNFHDTRLQSYEDNAFSTVLYTLDETCAEALLSVPGIAGKIPKEIALDCLSLFFDTALPYFKDRTDICWTEEQLWRKGDLRFVEGPEKGRANKAQIHRRCMLAAGGDEALAGDFAAFITAIVLKDIKSLKEIVETKKIFRFMPLYAVGIKLCDSLSHNEIEMFLQKKALEEAKGM